MSDTDNAPQDMPAQDQPINIIAQYVRDMSFENPNATDVLLGGRSAPQMDINIGMDARKIPDNKRDNLYEVVLNLRAEGSDGDKTMFIAELQYGVALTIDEKVPEENIHPMLLIEVPRLAFPFARQAVAQMTIQGGYPPLLLNPVDFYALYMQRFGNEIEAAKAEIKDEIKDDVAAGVKAAAAEAKKSTKQ